MKQATASVEAHRDHNQLRRCIGDRRDRWRERRNGVHGDTGARPINRPDLVSRFESPGLNVKGSVVYDAVSPAGGLAQTLRDKPDTARKNIHTNEGDQS